jgi:hypothetical protein
LEVVFDHAAFQLTAFMLDDYKSAVGAPGVLAACGRDRLAVILNTLATRISEPSKNRGQRSLMIAW